MRRWLRFAGVVTLVCWGSIVIGRVQAAGINRLNAGKDPKVQANQAICLKAVGVVKQQGKKTLLEFQPEFAPALKGLQDFSHLWVFYWFHENDRPEARATLQVHPRRDPADLDARDGSPILDLKPYIPEGDAIAGATTPAWLKRAKPPAD
jgi:tRNA (Thr-GGU) A37 N-methylase